MLSKSFSQKDEQKRLSNRQQKSHELNQMSSLRILLIVLTTTLTQALRIQKITPKQTEPMTQKPIKSIKFQLEY